MGARVASFGALLVSNAPSHDDGQGGTEPHLYTTSAEGTFHSLQGAVLCSGTGAEQRAPRPGAGHLAAADRAHAACCEESRAGGASLIVVRLSDAAEAKKMHHIAELLFYCSMGNLKAIKRLVSVPA